MNYGRITSVEPIPRSVAWLGYGGLLPFLALAAGCFAGAEGGAICRVALILYGAVILSFVGALHWAFAMTLPDLGAAKRAEGFIWSVVPALLAWPAAMLTTLAAQAGKVGVFYSAAIAATLLIAGFVANYVQDVRLARAATLPWWYLPLRLRLTSVACVCVAVAGFVHTLG
jgi:hypothetical protein